MVTHLATLLYHLLQARPLGYNVFTPRPQLHHLTPP